jgi:exonuclease SbcD
LLVGNHDMPGMAVKANSLDIFRALDVPGVIVGYKDEGRIVETKSGPVFLAWMPYPMRNRLMSWTGFQGKSIEELNQGLRAEVSSRLRDLAEQAGEHDMPRVLAGHFTVEAASYGSERSVMLGSDLPILRSTVAEETWDYVALGHLHKHQDVNEGAYPPVVYSGSLERIDFGEQQEQKGFVSVELRRGETRWRFVPVNARPFHTVKLDVRLESDPMAVILNALEGHQFDQAVVRVAITMSPEQSSALREREIESLLENAQSVSIVRDIEIEARARLGEFAPETLTPRQLLEQYFQSRDVSLQRQESLLARADEIFTSSD